MPPVEQVRPGLWSIPVPIPDNPLRYVLVYAFELDGGGVAMVDAGWNTEDAWAALSDGLAAAGGSVSDVRAVLVTHIHPDHYGLAGRVREASGAWIGLHPADAAMLEARYGDTDELVDRMLRSWPTPACRPTSSPTWPWPRWPSSRMVTMAEPGRPVRGRAGRRPPRVGPAHDVDTGPLARARLLLQRGAPAAAVRRPRPPPDHPQHLGPHPAVPQPAGRLPGVAAQGAGPRRRRGAARPRVPVLRPGGRVDRDHGRTTPTARRDRAGDRRAARAHRVGHHPAAAVVAPLGRDPAASCNVRPTARPWPTACCWSCTGGSAAREGHPACFSVVGSTEDAGATSAPDQPRPAQRRRGRTRERRSGPGALVASGPGRPVASSGPVPRRVAERRSAAAVRDEVHRHHHDDHHHPDHGQGPAARPPSGRARRRGRPRSRGGCSRRPRSTRRRRCRARKVR